MQPEPAFTAQQAADTQMALRSALGLQPEHFPLPDFIGMISDEIEQLRHAGKTDEQIASLISDSAGVAISPDAVTRYYASPEARGHHGH